MEVLWIWLISILCVAYADPVRICVPESVSVSCSQMELDLPETFKCVIAPDTFTCVEKVQKGDADITNVDPTALYLAGKYRKLRPIATELVEGEPFRYEGIALVRKGTHINSANDLRNRTSCHTGMRRTVGWQIPLGRLLSGNIMPAHCEEGELGAVENFFSGSCVPGDWSSDPIVNRGLKAKYRKLCSQCKNPSACSKDDEYAGYEGVMKCLADEAGDVAFTKIPALRDYLEKNPAFADTAEILCYEGGRKSVHDPNPCIWGVRPTNAYVARQNDLVNEDTELTALLQTQTRYSTGKVRIPDWYHKSFLSHSQVSGLRRTEEDRNDYVSYLGDFIHTIRKPRRGCKDVKQNIAIICVTSDEEMQKCIDFSMAAYVRGLWPEIRCGKSSSKGACMTNVQTDNVHLLILDGGDVYKAGRYYKLQPIASELYNNSDATYYAVAVMRSSSDVTHIRQLRGLRSCHTGMGRTAGWVMPVGFLISEGLLPPGETCSRTSAMADFFEGGSCVPGANDTKINPGRVRSEDLCRHCIGDDLGQNKCARSSKERYSGYAGALRCLAEGQGDVAFVKHTTVSDYTDGHSHLDWAKDLLSSNFKLLCDKGGVEIAPNYQQCNLGKVPSHQVVTRGNLTEVRRLQLARLLADTSKYFSNDSNFYRLFRPGKHPDLLFKDSATGLKITPPEHTYEEVLGQRFLEASRSVDPKVCIH